MSLFLSFFGPVSRVLRFNLTEAGHRAVRQLVHIVIYIDGLTVLSNQDTTVVHGK